MARKRAIDLGRSGRLTELRELAGLDQTDVARAVGVAQSTVWRWEHGELRPTGEHALALLEVLGAL